MLRRVVKETQRVFPPFALAQRTASASFTLNEHTFDPGTHVYFSPYATHRLPQLYVAPALFRPERWLYIDPEPYEYLPLDATAHTDQIAAVVGTIAKTVLALLIERFRLALASGARVDRSVRLVLEPRTGPFMIIMSPRRPMIQRMARGNVRDMLILR